MKTKTEIEEEIEEEKLIKELEKKYSFNGIQGIVLCVMGKLERLEQKIKRLSKENNNLRSKLKDPLDEIFVEKLL